MENLEIYKIIGEDVRKPGYVIAFDWHENNVPQYGDYFPDIHRGESPIENIEEAIRLQKKFAKKTKGKYINICLRYVAPTSFLGDYEFISNYEYIIENMSKTSNEWLTDKTKCDYPQCKTSNIHESCRDCLVKKTDDFEQFLDDVYFDSIDKRRDCE